MEAYYEKLETLYPSIQYVNHLMVHSWGQKVIRFYDLDGNLIEVGTPMQRVLYRQSGEYATIRLTQKA